MAADEVVLVDEAGNPIGRADRTAVHTTHTPRHLAFSSYLFNGRGELLITRRALSKLTWPGVWTNSCCGHPRPGESYEDAIRRRISDELGLQVGEIVPVVPDFSYTATDASGIVENELCPVFAVFDVRGEPTPNPDEVAEWAWVDWTGFVTAISATPQAFSPWAAAQVPRLSAALAALDPSQPAQPDAAAALREIDSLLSAEIDGLSQLWASSASATGLDVLALDLPIWLGELLIGQGKQLRAQLAYWGFIAAGGRHGTPGYRQLIEVAAALETLHLFALIHDDVMDQAPERRGRPAAHMQATEWHRQAAASGTADRFGENLAILLGDLAQTLAARLAGGLSGPLRRLWHEMWVELIAGQRADLTGAAAGRRDLAYAEAVATLKSGRYSVTRPLQLGATAAGADQRILDQLQVFGDQLGRAFALRDDYLGIWGDPAVTGKSTTNDLVAGKATLPLGLAAERLQGADAELLGRVGTTDFTAADVPELAAAMRAAGIDTEIEAQIDRAMAASMTALGSDLLTESGRAGLARAARAIAWRTS